MDSLSFLKRILAISQAGLTYGHDKYDKERYHDLHDLALRQLSDLGNSSLSKIKNLFANETGYPTPKVDVRAFIQKNKQVLMVEDGHGKWALPGGFGEVGWTLKENVAKEVNEETGLTAQVNNLRAIYDTDLRPDIPQTFQYYKFIFACSIDDGNFVNNIETIAMKWFSYDNLPPLSLKRTTKAQLKQLFDSPKIYIE